MAEAKTYQSVHPYQTFTIYKKDARRPKLIAFNLKQKGHGEYTTDDPEIIKYLESRDAFKTGKIRVKWSPVEKAEDVVRIAEAGVAKAQKVLKEAKDALDKVKGGGESKKPEATSKK